MSAICFPPCVTSFQPFSVCAPDGPRRLQRWGCRESEVTLNTSHHFKKPSFFYSQGGWGCGRHMDPYLMSLLLPQEEHWQLTALQQVTMGFCRASTAKVLPYFISPTVGIFELLIYLLFLLHTLSMSACQARQVTHKDWRILPSCCCPRTQESQHLQKNDWWQ